MYNVHGDGNLRRIPAGPIYPNCYTFKREDGEKEGASFSVGYASSNKDGISGDRSCLTSDSDARGRSKPWPEKCQIPSRLPKTNESRQDRGLDNEERSLPPDRWLDQGGKWQRPAVALGACQRIPQRRIATGCCPIRPSGGDIIIRWEAAAHSQSDNARINSAKWMTHRPAPGVKKDNLRNKFRAPRRREDEDLGDRVSRGYRREGGAAPYIADEETSAHPRSSVGILLRSSVRGPGIVGPQCATGGKGLRESIEAEAKHSGDLAVTPMSPSISFHVVRTRFWPEWKLDQILSRVLNKNTRPGLQSRPFALKVGPFDPRLKCAADSTLDSSPDYAYSVPGTRISALSTLSD
ncbi:hypothetical protein B0H17DRAFT_1140644 [Mycena rosella]|uniref:Uncharacterized protein n=1 Tax=Mycena rosella TaxID=1033263 RepID=A0AAD7GB19_MYCRO|nr:hypothetical protein B0H17DRAFT_1140644 [Mycena rosella]